MDSISLPSRSDLPSLLLVPAMLIPYTRLSESVSVSVLTQRSSPKGTGCSNSVSLSAMVLDRSCERWVHTHLLPETFGHCAQKGHSVAVAGALWSHPIHVLDKDATGSACSAICSLRLASDTLAIVWLGSLDRLLTSVHECVLLLLAMLVSYI